MLAFGSKTISGSHAHQTIHISIEFSETYSIHYKEHSLYKDLPKCVSDDLVRILIETLAD